MMALLRPNVLALCLALLLGHTGLARAEAFLNFTQGAALGGTVTYAGGLAPMIGTNIPILQLATSGDILNAGTYAIVGGLLNFRTGPFAFTNATPTTGGGDEFLGTGGGAFLEVKGAIPELGINTTSVLLTGTFDPTARVYILSLGSFNDVSGIGTDNKNTTLLEYFGLPASAAWTFAVTSHEPGRLPTDNNANKFDGSKPFAYNARNFSVQDHTTASYVAPDPVPEPMSLLLVGSGLGLIVQRIRRRRVAPAVG